jgi:hypothetical protein
MIFNSDDRTVNDSARSNVLVLYAIPFSLLLQVETVGRVIALEVILAFIGLIYFLKPRLTLSTSAKSIFFGLGVWLGASILSDILNSSSLTDLARGWARLLFLGMSFWALLNLLITEDDWLAFFGGLMLALAVEKYIESPVFQTAWKFGLGAYSALFLVSVLLFPYRSAPQRLLPLLSIIFLVYASVSLMLNCRSLSAGFAFATLITFGLSDSRRRQRLSDLLHGSVALPLILIAIVSYGLGFAYVKLVDNGLFGTEALDKLESQRWNNFDPVLGMLLGGRNEIYASTAAIGDSPLIGHGSWAKGAEYVEIYRHAQSVNRDYGELIFDDNGSDLIPTHSHFFGAWVDSGFVGAIFWLLILYYLFRAFRSSVFVKSRSQVIILCAGFWLVWDIFFSPFGALIRVWWAVFFVAIARNGFIEREAER